MISQLFLWMVKYAFDCPVVAMVSHSLVKSQMAVNYLKQRILLGICIWVAGVLMLYGKVTLFYNFPTP